ncbi:HvfC/BufC N-terminal domain-containing protein [Streptomyces halobius]|uniref:DNA-binding domain-containing protein n=1 Tax=Streptomyces halobius TaxID=2879846 RepID=A0ABY4MHX2_9ACTN|nr:DNA-binding domain-containing protein [Streptomyces halobius]UQA97401.1 DNA-binding domain-containing protein [Streptomyces halobius]
MASPPVTLADTQRWLQHAILTPDGPPDAVDEVLTPSTELSARQRLDVYRRGYRLRLLEAMRELHPALRALLGPELFDDFALDYLDARPSRSYTLCQLDARFVEHLCAHRPDRGLPDGQREGWVDVIVDLARYERAFAEVYDGPGTEGGAPGWSGTVPAPASCLRVLRVCAPVHTYHAAVRRGRPAEPPAPGPVHLALWRRDYTIKVTELEPDAYRLLSARLAEGGA